MHPRDHVHPRDCVNLGGHMCPRDHMYPGDHMHPKDCVPLGDHVHLRDRMPPGGHAHHGALIPAHCRGSIVTITGTHLDSVYRAKIRFEASGVRTEATVSTGAGECCPLTLPCPPLFPGYYAMPVCSIPLPAGVRGPTSSRTAAVPQPTLPLREQCGDSTREPERVAGWCQRPLALPPPLLPPAQNIPLGAGGQAPSPQTWR